MRDDVFDNMLEEREERSGLGEFLWPLLFLAVVAGLSGAIGAAVGVMMTNTVDEENWREVHDIAYEAAKIDAEREFHQAWPYRVFRMNAGTYYFDHETQSLKTRLVHPGDKSSKLTIDEPQWFVTPPLGRATFEPVATSAGAWRPIEDYGTIMDDGHYIVDSMTFGPADPAVYWDTDTAERVVGAAADEPEPWFEDRDNAVMINID